MNRPSRAFLKDLRCARAVVICGRRLGRTWTTGMLKRANPKAIVLDTNLLR